MQFRNNVQVKVKGPRKARSVSALKGIQGSETSTRELLEEQNRKKHARWGGHYLTPRHINDPPMKNQLDCFRPPWMIAKLDKILDMAWERAFQDDFNDIPYILNGIFTSGGSPDMGLG